MCFSAAASFTASVCLTGVGIASLRIATKKQIIIAVIPLLFAIQQAIEGFQWLAVGAGHVSACAGYSFMFFALILWPLYIPITVYIFDKQRRYITRWFIGISIALVSYFVFILFRAPMQIEVLKHGIYYKIPMLFGRVTGTLYFIAICGALLASSIRPFRIFGVATCVSVFIAALLFSTTFASTWCFFAAFLSSLIYVYIKQNRQA